MKRVYSRRAGGVLVLPNHGGWMECLKGHDFAIEYLEHRYSDPQDFFDDLVATCPACVHESAKAKRAKQAYQNYRANHKRGRLRG